MNSSDRSDRRAPWVLALVLILVGGAAAVAQTHPVPKEAEEEPGAEQVDVGEAGAVGDADESIPWEQRQAMERPLRERAEKLGKEKNSAGIENRRGRYSRKFDKIDDDTYTVTFTESTASKYRLKIDRYLLTLKREGGDEWTVADEELRDTFDKMYRSWGIPRAYPFEGFEIDREGLVVRGGSGKLVPNFVRDEIRGFTIVPDRATFEYAPPADVPIDFFDEVYKVWTKRFKRNLDFQPSMIDVTCDPESCADLLASIRGLPEIAPPAEPDEDGDWSVPDVSGLPGKIADGLRETYRRVRENPFRGFQPPVDPENRYWQIRLDRNDANWFGMSYDNFDPEEVSVGARFGDTFYGQLFQYYAEETRNSGADPYELEQRPDENARYYHLTKVDGTIEAALLDPETYEAQVDFSLQVTRDLTQKWLPFFIATIQSGDNESRSRPSLNMNRVVYKGEELTVVRTSGFGGIIVLPEVIEAGETVDLSVDFTAKAIQKNNHAYSGMYRGGWLPFVRFGDMIDEFRLTIKVPSEYKTLGVGRKVAERTEGDQGEVNVTEWVADSPVAFPTIIFGKYIEADPSDAFQAKKSDGTEIPVTVHVDEVSMGTLEIDVASANDAQSFSDDFRAGARGIRTKQLKPIGVQAATAIDYYQKISGIEYPYGELNLVNDPAPALYGQAPSSLIYLGSNVFRGEGTMAGGTVLGSGGTSTAKFLKSVVAHEVGHQWWGSAIANANSRNYWFVESLAEFFSALWLEEAFGPEEYAEQVDEWRRRIMDIESFTSVQRADTGWGGEFPGATRQALIYNKGPYAFHILRTTFGDEKFFPFLKQFCMRLHEMKEITTRDIQRVAEEELGGVDENGNRYKVDLEWFFDQWIRGVGVPEYALMYDVRRNEDGNWIIEGKVQQQVVMGNARNKVVLPNTYYRGVVPITVVIGKGKEYQKRLLIEGPESPFTLLVPERPRDVVLNKNGEILAHDVKVNQPIR